MFEEFKKYYDLDRGDCLVCNSTEHSLWAKHEYFKAIECSDCGFVYMNPSINPEGLNEFYTNYIGDRFQNQKKMDDREIQYEIDAAFVQGFLTQGKILDVGCNGGFFLSKLSNDFEKYGIEVDSEAVEYANKNYRFNIVSPGFTKTSYYNDFKKNKRLYDWTKSKIPMKRWGNTSEISSLVNFLISDRSEYLTGQEIFIDGGWTV